MMMTGGATAVTIAPKHKQLVSVDRKKKKYIWVSSGGSLDWFG